MKNFLKGLFGGIIFLFILGCNDVNAEGVTINLKDISNIKSDSATFNANVNISSSSSNVAYWFEYGTSETSFSNKTESIAIVKSGVVSKEISNLTPNTVYYYRICAKSSLDVTCSGRGTFKTYYYPTFLIPEIKNITDISAEFSGTVTDLGGTTAEYYFEYDTDYNFKSKKTTTSKKISEVGNVSASVSALSPKTMYYVRFCIKPSYLTTGLCSSLVSFTTKDFDISTLKKPVIGKNPTHYFVTQNSIKLFANLLDKGDFDSFNYYFEYGENLTNVVKVYSTNPVITKVGEFSVDVNDLLFGKTYYYRACVIGKDKKGNSSEEVCSDFSFLNVFDTLNSPLGVENISITERKQDSLKVNGSVTGFASNSFLNIQINYYSVKTGERRISPTISIQNTARNFSVVVDGLEQGTEYKYSICLIGVTAPYCTSESSFSTIGIPHIDKTNYVCQSKNSVILRAYIKDIDVKKEDYEKVKTWFVYSMDPNLTNSKSTTKISYNGDITTQTLTGLKENSTYYYKFCINDGITGDVCSSITTFVVNEECANSAFYEPNIQLIDFKKITSDTVKIFGRVIDLGNDESAKVYVSYGDDKKNLVKSSVYVAKENNEIMEVNISGIKNNDVYYYKICIENTTKSFCGDLYTFSLFNGRGYGDFYKPDVGLKEARYSALVAERYSGKMVALNGDYSSLWYIDPIFLNRYYLGDYKNGFKVSQYLARELSEEEFEKLDYEHKKANSNYAGQFIFSENDPDTIYYVDNYTYRMWYFVNKDEMAFIGGNNVEYISQADLLKINYLELEKIDYILKNESDLDQDGILDDIEINIYRTNPYNIDTDGDGYLDPTEIERGYSPTIAIK